MKKNLTENTTCKRLKWVIVTSHAHMQYDTCVSITRENDVL